MGGCMGGVCMHCLPKAGWPERERGEAKESGSKGLEVASILFRFRQNCF